MFFPEVCRLQSEARSSVMAFSSSASARSLLPANRWTRAASAYASELNGDTTSSASHSPIASFTAPSATGPYTAPDESQADRVCAEGRDCIREWHRRKDPPQLPHRPAPGECDMTRGRSAKPTRKPRAPFVHLVRFAVQSVFYGMIRHGRRLSGNCSAQRSNPVAQAFDIRSSLHSAEVKSQRLAAIPARVVLFRSQLPDPPAVRRRLQQTRGGRFTQLQITLA